MESKPFWNPYVAGVALGLVLLASFLVMGFGLGSSGAVTRIGIGLAHTVAPEAVEQNGYFAHYFGGTHILDNWLVFLFLGIFVGGLAAAYSGGRLKLEVLRGERRLVSSWQRLGLAVLGGILMGVAARFSRGCTSGQALSGGALLSVGSWVFMLAVFAGGYLMAPIVRRQWR
jgi:uncharacterized membrane protein YedE/YeeE